MTLAAWQGSFNGLIFGGQGNNVGIVEITGWESLPDIRSGDTPYPRAAGSLNGLDLPGQRTIGIKMEVAGATPQLLSTLLDAVNGALTTQMIDDKPLVLMIPGQGERQSFCRLRKRNTTIDIEYAGGITSIDTMFVASDPRLYSATLHSLSTGLPVPSSGRTFNAPFPLTFGGTTGGGGQILAANIGNYPTQGVATITGPVINPRVQNTNTGQQVALNLTLGSGDSVVIDFAAHTVKLNGNGYRYSATTDADWWALAPGVTTTIGFYSSDPSPTGATLTFAWRDAWL